MLSLGSSATNKMKAPDRSRRVFVPPRQGRQVRKPPPVVRGVDTYEISGKEFTVVDRGLDRDEVREYIGRLLRNPAETGGEDEGGVLDADIMIARADERARGIIKEAEEKAGEVIRQAQEEAEQILDKSRKLADKELKERLRKTYDEFWKEMKSVKGLKPSKTSGGKEGEVTEEPAEGEQLPLAMRGEKLADEQSEASEEELYQRGLSEDGWQDPWEGLPIYQGLVELVVTPPVGSNKVMRLHKNLRHIPEIEILNLGMSDDKGFRMGLYLENPLPLLDILWDFPEVERVWEVQPEYRYRVYGHGWGSQIPDCKLILSFSSQ